MATEEEIRELAYTLWEQEGCPEGKDQEHYYRAKKTLDDKEGASVIQLPAPPAPAQLTSSPSKQGFGWRKKI